MSDDLPDLPGLPGEPVVGAAVDDDDVLRQPSGHRPRLAVRQGEEDDVGARERLGRRLGEAQAGERAQMRLDVAEQLPGVGVGGDGGHLEVGMRGQEPEQLASRVSARAGDGDGEGHDSTLGFDGRGARRRRRANG